MICEGEGCCLEQWCLYVHRLKSGFSRVDFGPLFIQWVATILSDSLNAQCPHHIFTFVFIQLNK